jgi:peptide/nickel transport system permease protein
LARFILRRLVGIVPLALVVSVVCFALMYAVPGGPEGMFAGNPKVKPDDVARIRSNFGLDRPVPVQYLAWLGRVVLHGDFGVSYTTGEPVIRMIAGRVPATLELMGSALALAVLLGLGVGSVSALARRGTAESIFLIGSLVVIAVPLFWLGLMSVMVFSVKWMLLPSGGTGTLGAAFSVVDHVRHLALPAMVLSLAFAASWSRYTRESLADVLDEKYITVARAKGLSPAAVLVRHGLRNAVPPVVTVIAVGLPALFTGSVVVETIFAWPGMGRLFYDGILKHDYTRVMGVVFVSSLLVALFNLVADCLHGILDPRTRFSR